MLKFLLMFTRVIQNCVGMLKNLEFPLRKLVGKNIIYFEEPSNVYPSSHVLINLLEARAPKGGQTGPHQ